MKYQTEGNTIVLVLEKREDIIGSVTKIAQQYNGKIRFSKWHWCM